MRSKKLNQKMTLLTLVVALGVAVYLNWEYAKSTDLALDAAVNPNTMQKALSELERSGLVYSHRTSGRFITDDSTLLKKIKTDLAQEYISSFLEQMSHLGISGSETLEMIKQTLGGGDNETNS